MRIATFNLENLGRYQKGASFENRAAVLRPQLDRLKADVLCLQEVDAPKVRGTRRAVYLERLLRGTFYAEHCLAVSSGLMGTRPADVHNLAVLTRLPVIGSTPFGTLSWSPSDSAATLPFRPTTMQFRLSGTARSNT